MRIRFLIILFSLSVLVFTAQAQPPTPTPTDWKLTGKTGAADGAGPVYLYADSSVLIAVYFQGVYRSADKGKTWSLIGLPTYRTHNILRVGTTLVAATGEGFWRSTDNGALWRSANSSLAQWFGGDNAQSLTLMNGVIYAGMGEFAGSPRCLLSRDEGLTWERADKGLEAAKNGFSMANLNGVLLYGDRDGKL
ncbi:MAG: exo-alpha-sialidase, partial [Acidobacteria bacterium]|nr:exo-alpha-sialidase [Acidobacteriota bacterium]